MNSLSFTHSTHHKTSIHVCRSEDKLKKIILQNWSHCSLLCVWTWALQRGDLIRRAPELQGVLSSAVWSGLRHRRLSWSLRRCAAQICSVPSPVCSACAFGEGSTPAQYTPGLVSLCPCSTLNYDRAPSEVSVGKCAGPVRLGSDGVDMGSSVEVFRQPHAQVFCLLNFSEDLTMEEVIGA